MNGWTKVMPIDINARGSTWTVKTVIFSGTSISKKLVNVTKDKYIPPAVATNSVIASDAGEDFGESGVLSKARFFTFIITFCFTAQYNSNKNNNANSIFVKNKKTTSWLIKNNMQEVVL